MNYKPRLDGLRFIAIMMVLLGHFLYVVGGVINSGVYGVNLFFVLSGYLITSILLKERGNGFKLPYKKFIARRALRIFPLYYAVIVFFIIIDVPAIKEEWPYLVTYTYNIQPSFIEGWEHFVYAPYWSLSVEEQFYLFFPFVVLLLNNKPRIQLLLFVIIILIAYIERSFNFLVPRERNYVSLITNMGALAIGATGAWLTQYKYLNNWFFNSLIVEVLMFLGLAVVLTSKSDLLYFMIVPFFNLFLVIKASSYQFQLAAFDKMLTHKWSLLIGKISYGIYIYHIMVLKFFEEYIFGPLWKWIPFDKLGYFSKLKYNETLIRFPFLMITTIAIAYISFRYFESPILKLKDRYFSSSRLNPVNI